MHHMGTGWGLAVVSVGLEVSDVVSVGWGVRARLW
ncbi:MAG: hypothetical protein RI897_3942 [Verrucomicrobiota bacterium]